MGVSVIIGTGFPAYMEQCRCEFSGIRLNFTNSGG